MYDRNKAVEYARENINGWSMQYPDYDSKHTKKGDPTDCANFVSQCLHAGGITFSLSALLRFYALELSTL